MRFRFIDAERAGLAMPIFRLCRLLQVSVSGFYAWRNRGPSQRQLDDMVLLAHVRAAFRRSRESYGAERVHHELAENGIEVGRHRVARLMRGNGLSPKRKQKFKKTTDSQHNKAVASNLLDQNFSAEAPNEKWAADISYIWTAQGWLYLAVMLDLYSRRVIGWAVGARMTSDLPLRALNRAIGLRQPGAGVIHHSDRGSQGGFPRSDLTRTAIDASRLIGPAALGWLDPHSDRPRCHSPDMSATRGQPVEVPTSTDIVT